MVFVSSQISRMAFRSKNLGLLRSTCAPNATISNSFTGNKITMDKTFKSVMGPGAYFSSKSDTKDAVKKDGINADGPYDYGYHCPDQRFRDGKPTRSYAKAMPNNFCSMRHEQILQLCAEGVDGARREALIRNIMSVDDVDYDVATVKMDVIAKVNRQWLQFDNLPYSVGLTIAVTGGLASFPLVFHFDTVVAFNDAYVTADVPEPKDLETWLEVGSWSWAWMEPVLGQASFALLVAQFARSQMINLGIKPYGNLVKNLRSKRLVKLYPQYDKEFVHLYSETAKLFN